jgi:Leucine-rich repeat (LRR) protein
MLFLHHNKLSYLPGSIDKLINLEVLHINHNRFQEFPRQILSLKKLRDLDFSNNEITDLPYEITNLDKLYLLFIQVNPYDEEAKETLESMIGFYESKEVSFNY